MATLMRATALAAATAAVTLFAQSALSATVQPSLIVSDVGKSAKLVDLVGRRGGGGFGHRKFVHRGFGHRKFFHRRFGHRHFHPGFYAYGGCRWGYRWS